MGHEPPPPWPPQHPPQQEWAGLALERAGASPPTAKLLIARSVFFDPHLGHSIVSLEFIDRSSFSNRSPHLTHWYS